MVAIGGVILVFEATVPVLLVPVLVVPELDVVLLPEAGVVAAVPGAVDVVLDATAALLKVFWALSTASERSIMPTFGETSAGAASAASALATVLLEPDPPPQAARLSVASVHRRTLRNCA
jgi:hypothetical protein